MFTLLDSKALDAVEHMTLEEMSAENGADIIWKLLASRFPEKEAHDQMGEALGEAFGLSAKEGESAQQWTARVKEVFDKCRRKANVTFSTRSTGMDHAQLRRAERRAEGDREGKSAREFGR